MPELPEVETVRRTLEPAVGRQVTGVWTSGLPLRLLRPIDRAGLERAAVGARIAAVRRHGKYLLLDFAGRDELVLVHLGMSGRLRLVRSDEPRAPHTHVVLALDGPQEIRFSDPRRFGMVDVAPAAERAREHPALAVLGRDPLHEKVTGAFLHQAARRTRQNLKALLLDQGVVAGVGNIYASEALWLARLSPKLRGIQLDRRGADALARAVSTVLRHALVHGGTTLSDFVDADGVEGENADYLRVYDRAGQRCARRGCPGRIRRTVIQGRATFHCPHCQSRQKR
jgi:formamidopyrimidine-DNA glycosylase